MSRLYCLLIPSTRLEGMGSLSVGRLQVSWSSTRLLMWHEAQNDVFISVR